MEARRESDGRIMSEYSCIRREDALSLMGGHGSAGEASGRECRIHECPSGYMAVGSRSRDLESGREGFEFSCVLPGQHVPSLRGLI
jgi:hypothetical protein